MKRRDLIRHLEAHGCEFVREGKEHTLYINRQTKKATAVPVIVRYRRGRHAPSVARSVSQTLHKHR
jgi:hypothetical protein